MDEHGPKPQRRKPGSSTWGSVEEATARAARQRLRAEGIVPIEVDGPVLTVLEPDEIVITMRRDVAILDAGTRRARSGDFYVTDRRLLLVGPEPFACGVGEIREVGLASERLLLVLADGRGHAIVAADPHVLRVQIAAAREGARAAGSARARTQGHVPSR